MKLDVPTIIPMLANDYQQRFNSYHRIVLLSILNPNWQLLIGLRCLCDLENLLENVDFDITPVQKKPSGKTTRKKSRQQEKYSAQSFNFQLPEAVVLQLFFYVKFLNFKNH